MMDNHNGTGDELHWQACRYVAGEMNAAEHERFAELLAEDQPAREAVARAVELLQATATALAVPSVARRNNSRLDRRWAGLAAGLAASIAVAFGVAQWRNTDRSMASAADDALAVQWSEVRQQQAEALPWNNVGDEAASDDEALLSLDELELRDAEITATPEWMLAAVLEQRTSEDMLEHLPGDIERGSEDSQEQ